MLETKNLTVGYNRRPILSDINVTLLPGKMTVLIGSNGSGKSTLLRTLSGAQPPLSGDILINGNSIQAFSSQRLSRILSVVLTDRIGGGGLRVKELVSIGRYPHTGFLNKLSEFDNKEIYKALDMVGLIRKSECYVSELSDGERQKAMIARAVAQDTSIIILDEPTSFLDVASRFEIIELLHSLAHNQGKAILLSTHDTAAALPKSDQIWAVVGEKLHSGNINDLNDLGILDLVFTNIGYDNKSMDFRPDK